MRRCNQATRRELEERPRVVSAPPTPQRLHCLVEIPKGSRNKYEWNEELQAITLDRFLFSSVVYPTDYGFIPDTLAEDGDPLDAMVCVSEPTFPGCVIEVKVIDPNWNTMEVLDDLPQPLRDEISHFFSIYKQPEGKHVMVDGWFPREHALEQIDASRQRWAEQQG
jgi:inorganic pyrophosphatase